MPMSWIVIALVASFFIKKYSKKLRLAALIILLFFGNSFILNEVKLLWEVPVTLDQNLDHYKYGVVLGGYAYYSPENDRITFAKSGDRLFQGLRLLKTDYVDQLILSGGSGYAFSRVERIPLCGKLFRSDRCVIRCSDIGI